MMPEPSLFDHQHDDFGGHVDTWWRDCAERALDALAATGRPFQVSEIRDEPWSVPEPHHPNAYGGLTRWAASAGLIEHVGYAKSTHPSRNGAIVKVWRGVARGGEAA